MPDTANIAATRLATPRNINGVPFDGTADITVSGTTGSSGLTMTAVKTANYTAAAGEAVPVDTTSGLVTLTLPTAPANGVIVAAKKLDATIHTAVLTCGGSDKINTSGGGTTYTLRRKNQAVQLVYSSGIWYVVNTDPANLIPGFISGHYYYANSPQAQGSTSNTLGFGTCRVSPWQVIESLTIASLWAEFSAAGDAGTVFRPCIYADDGTGLPGALLLDPGTVSMAGTPGSIELTGLSQVVPPGNYHIGGALQGGTSQPTVRTIAAIPQPWNISLGTSLPAQGTAAVGFAMAGVTGAMPGTFTIASRQGTVPRIGIKAA